MSEESEIIREAIEGLSRKHRENLVQVVEQGLRARVLDSFRLLRKPWFTCPECGQRRFRTLFRGVYRGRVNVPYVICLSCSWLGWDVVFSDGFETNNFNAWTATEQGSGGTISTASISPHHGIYHLDAIATATANSYAVATDTFVSTYATLYTRIYVMFHTSLTGGDWYFLDHFNSTAAHNIARVYITGTTNTKKWKVLYHVGTTDTYSSSLGDIINLDQWYCVELMNIIHASAGEVHLWVDGSELLTVTGKDTNDYGNVDKIRVGMTARNEATACELYMDCVVSDINYIGPEASVKKSGDVMQNVVTALVSGRFFT